MKKIISLILFILISHLVFSQRLFNNPKSQSSPNIRSYTVLDLDSSLFNKIRKEKPSQVKIDSLQLYKVENTVNVVFSDGIRRNLPDVINYRGKISGDNNSFVAVTFTDNEVMGLICNKSGNRVIGKYNGKHIIYNDKDLTSNQQLECAVSGDYGLTGTTTTSIATLTTKKVNWYWETDYDLFLNKGSAANVNSYIQGIFNQVATLYANDGIQIVLKTLYIWTTPDPYSGTSSGAYQLQFATYRQAGFAGDLAHLIGLKGTGGVANVGTLCTIPYYETAYSQINSTYSNVPAYSFTVYCIAHEEGHLLGSRHTHDCVWNGNNTVIDACGQLSGYPSPNCGIQPKSPIPYGVGGTIMSYCNRLFNVGINFSLGFGQQPRTKIVNSINNAPCLK